MSYIGESAAGFVCAGRDGKIYIRTFGEGKKEIPLNLFKTFKFGEEYKISKVAYENGIESFKFGDETRNTLWINQENMFIVDEYQVKSIYNKINGLTVNSFEGTSIIDPTIDMGDILIVGEKPIIYQGQMNFANRFIVDINSKINIKQRQETTVKKSSQKLINRRFESRINEEEGEISQLAEEQTDFSKEITEHKQNINSITDEVNRIYDFTKTVRGKNELLLEDCLPTNMLKFTAYANTTGGLFPSGKLFPSKKLFPKRGGSTITIVIGRTSRVVAPDPILPSKKLFPKSKLYPRSNGYYKREYSFYIATPLRHFNDIHDRFIIEVDQEEGICTAKVLRYIQVDFKTGATTILENPIEEIIGETYLELYKGNNYVYIKEFTDWQMEATYIFNNELNEWYAPRVETNSKIKQTVDEIELKVSEKAGKDEIVSLINLSPEEIKIQSNKLALEGLTTINGGFSIDEKGNASIANDTVLINDKGIQMKDGATLVGGKGLLTNLQYTGLNHAFMDYSSQGDFGYIGYWVGEDWETSRIYVNKSYTTIIADIPANFSIEMAYITLIHRPIVGDYPISESASATKKIIGTSRNIGLYKGSLSTYVTRDVAYSNFSEIDLDVYSEIEGAFGENGWTPYIATDTSNAKIETTRSLNIAKYLKVGEVNKLKIETRDNLAIIGKDYYETEINMAPYSGMILPILNIYGFLKLE